MFNSSYSKILHDPECQIHCCSKSFGRPMVSNNFHYSEEYSNSTTCYSDESIVTTSTSENQFLYEVNSLNNRVPELQEILNQSLVDKLGMAHSDLSNSKPVKTTYITCSIDTNSAETQLKQRNNCKGVMKRKRKRTIFSTEQIIVMEGVFNKRPYVTREERVFLSQQLNISEKAIKIWFQNRRRVTEKRDRDQTDSCHSDSTVEEVCNDHHSRLDYIESQISQNTDEYGFVTLDSKALTELVKLIDNALSHSIEYHKSPCDENKNNDYLMYEPVSPESSLDDKESENILKWEPSEPEESIQRLIDIHDLLYN